MNAPKAPASRPASGVSLVCVDCQYPRLAHRAMVKSLEQCQFAAARLLTDDVHAVPEPDPRIEILAVPRIASTAEYSRFMLKELLRYVTTDHVQVVQWDGYVVRGAAWSEEFTQWDYIGARWWFRPEGSNVGNGGFSLRSRRLLEALQDEDILVDDNEDSVIGVSARGRLESRHGIRIAPAAIADRYAFEGAPPSGSEFGFHRVSNLPYFTQEQELAEVLDCLSDATFAGLATVYLVSILVSQGRRKEAMRYARRLRACVPGYSLVQANARSELERKMLGLVPRVDPCVCGSGVAYRRCCGALSLWCVV